MVKLTDTDDFLQQKAFEARYKFNTAEKEGSKTSGLFNSLVKFFVTEKVEIKTEANLPIFLLNKKYPERPIFKGADFKKQIEEISLKFQVHFNSLIWLCYRKNFVPLFVGEEEELTKWIQCLPKDLGRDLKIGHTTDSGWGCTIRVA